MDKSSSQNNDQRERFGINLFPLSLLVFQAVLLIFEIFHIQDIEAVNSMRQFLENSSLFLSILFSLLICYYIFRTVSKKKGQRDWKFTCINSGFCMGNIVLLNKLYNSEKLKSTLSSLLEKPIFVVLAIIALGVITYIALKKSKRIERENKQRPMPSQESPIRTEYKHPSTASQQQSQVQTEASANKSIGSLPNGRVMFSIVFLLLVCGIGFLVYYLVTRYNLISPILSEEDALSRVLSYALLIITGIAIVIILIIVITYVTQYICKSILSLPAFLSGKKPPEQRVVKIAFGIIGVPVFFGLTKLFKINMDWLMNMMQNRDYLVVPFTFILYFLLSMLFVEILYNLFSEKSNRPWLQKFKEIIADTGDSIIEICKNIVKSFLGLLKFPPDFLLTIEDLLLGENSEMPADETKVAPQGGDGHEMEGEDPT